MPSCCSPGALPVLAFPAPNLEFLAWFGLVPGLLLIRAAPTGRAGRRGGWWFGSRVPAGRAVLAGPEPGPGAAAGGDRARRAVDRRRGGRLGAAAPAGHGAGARSPPWSCVPELLAGRRVDPVLAGLRRPVGSARREPVAASGVLALAAVGGVWLVTFALVAANTGILIVDRGPPDPGPADRRGRRGDRDRGRAGRLRADPRRAGHPVHHDRAGAARSGQQAPAQGRRQPAAVGWPAPRPRRPDRLGREQRRLRPGHGRPAAAPAGATVAVGRRADPGQPGLDTPGGANPRSPC